MRLEMDIVKRLRKSARSWSPFSITDEDLIEAADEIERLREALEKLSKFDPNPSGSGPAYGQCGEMVRIARFALQQKDSE